jgi:uncharacterized protein YjdB
MNLVLFSLFHILMRFAEKKVRDIPMRWPMKQKVLGLLLVFVLMTGILPISVTAAVKFQIQPTSAVLDLARSTTLQLSARLSGAVPNDLTWRSENTSIATVNSNGLVTAKKTGRVRIGVRVPGKTSWSLCQLTVRRSSIKPTSIVLSRNRAFLLVGETLNVSATIKPANAAQSVIWQTSNRKVATVSPDGLITAKKMGTCRIRATSTARPKLRKYLILKVTDGIAPTKIRLNAPRTSLKIGEQMSLTPAITPENASNKLMWTSSNTRVATVSAGGVVTAKKVGTAKIRARSASKPKVYGTIGIRVQNPNAVDSIRVEADDFYLDKGTYRQLSATLSPAGSTIPVSWKSDKPTIASVTTTGKVTGLNPGSAIITATAGGKSDTVLVTVLTDERSANLPVRYVSNAGIIPSNSKKIQEIFTSALNELECCVARSKLSASERALRKEFLQRGFIMYDMAWAPSKDVPYWSRSTSYIGGRIYIGMPYTQYKRNYNLSKWLSNVSHTMSNGYYKVTMPGVSYPGNDCSSFVSICQFGMNTSNSYLNTTTLYSTAVYKTVINGFSSLMPGDILVKKGHTAMFLYYVTPDRIMVLEQGGGSEPNTISCNIKTISGTYRPQGYRVRRKADLPSA